MIHIRIDDDAENSGRRFACGLGPDMPEGDKYFFQSEEFWHHRVDCPGCNPDGQQRAHATLFGYQPQLGTPISELSGRPGELADQVGRLMGAMDFALICLNNGAAWPVDSRWFADEARRVLRMALEAESER